MALANIWRNRIEAGTKKYSNCPKDIKDNVTNLIRNDITSGDYSEDKLYSLIALGMLTSAEYTIIMEGV